MTRRVVIKSAVSPATAPICNQRLVLSKKRWLGASGSAMACLMTGGSGNIAGGIIVAACGGVMAGLTIGASGNTAGATAAASGGAVAVSAAGVAATKFAGAWPRAAHEKASNREKKLKTEFKRKSPSLGVSNLPELNRSGWIKT